MNKTGHNNIFLLPGNKCKFCTYILYEYFLFKNFIKLTNFDDSHDVHTCVSIKTDFRATFNCSYLSLSKSPYCVATLKSRRIVDQMMNASNPLFTVNTKPHSTCTFFLLAFFEDVTLSRALHVTYNYNFQISNYMMEKSCFL